MNIKKIIKQLICIHDYETKRWRLIHYNNAPLTRQVEVKCGICEKEHVYFGLKRDARWEEFNKNTKTTEVF